MTAQITWSISALDCRPKEGDLANVVITAHWRCTGTQTANNKTYSASVYSTCSFQQPGNPFIPFEQLTEQQVLGWIWTNGVDKGVTEAAVQQQIDQQITPSVITPPLPWSQA